MIKEYLAEARIASHEPASLFLTRFNNRARDEAGASTTQPSPVEADPETAARVAVLWAKLRKPVVIRWRV